MKTWEGSGGCNLEKNGGGLYLVQGDNRVIREENVDADIEY